MEAEDSPSIGSAELSVSDNSGNDSGNDPPISTPLALRPPKVSISPKASSSDGVQSLSSKELASESTAAGTADNQTSTSQPKSRHPGTDGDAKTQADYEKYVKMVSGYGYSSLDVVQKFIGSSREHSRCKKCLACEAFTPYLLLLSGNKVETLLSFDDHSNGSSSSRVSILMDTIKAQCIDPKTPGQQLVLLVENLKPSGLKILGGHLGVDPRAFARYLEADKEFTNSLPGVVVLDYVQGYSVEGPKADLFRLDQRRSLNGRRGKLKRIWRNVVGHEQRVVIANITNHSWRAPLVMVLFESIPPAAHLEIHQDVGSPRCRLKPFESVLEVPLFAEYCLTEAIPDPKGDTVRNSRLIRDSIIRAAAQKPNVKGDIIVIASLEFVCSKWQELASALKEAISESEIPDHLDVQLIRSITQRRRILGEMARTLATLGATATHNDRDQAGNTVKELEKTVRSWIADLDGTLSAMAVYLSLVDTARSIRQSHRTQQLTILALIFVPASTVATVFGMNIDVLSADVKPSYKWFILTAGVVTAVTFTYGVWFSYVNAIICVILSIALYFLSNAVILGLGTLSVIFLLFFNMVMAFVVVFISAVLDVAVYLLRRPCSERQLVFFSMSKYVCRAFVEFGILVLLWLMMVLQWVPPWYNAATYWKQGVILEEVTGAFSKSIPETVAGSYGPRRTNLRDRRAEKIQRMEDARPECVVM
ncbi:hypothetical protein QBC34DRAFT_438676 [Podospora aff. communis PSN243]|uniref:Chitin synthase n=1 Tax=Podospora aff. communis PSN243 TaxID=3040156 RepID=A0AAV9GK55_9PEZI|nr:hypothetical protein QBC34DRAFT_438676 [Podospora aff. communis PSN243]